MPPKPQKRDAFELFQSHFDQLLNPAHELVQLAQKIDWDRSEAAFAGGYSPDLGAPAKATRLMVGLRYLKYTFNESDESAPSRLRTRLSGGIGRRCDHRGAGRRRVEPFAAQGRPPQALP